MLLYIAFQGCFCVVRIDYYCCTDVKKFKKYTDQKNWRASPPARQPAGRAQKSSPFYRVGPARPGPFNTGQNRAGSKRAGLARFDTPSFSTVHFDKKSQPTPSMNGTATSIFS